MKIVRYINASGHTKHGVLQADGSALPLRHDLFTSRETESTPESISQLLAPLDPRVIFCIGLNYRKHAEEGKQPTPPFPVVFMKSPAAVQNPGGPIVLPRHLRSDKVDYEGELAIVIGERCKNVAPADALNYVLGYTIANDVSARDWQRDWGSNQWSRAKTFDTFCPLGPWIVTTDEIPFPNTLQLHTTLNGRVMQDWNTDVMIFDVPTLISFLSGSTTLLPGTLILTGTPHGVGFAQQPPVFLQPGDHIQVEIDGLGSLVNPVIEETVAN